jgi:hypothetical protein
LAVNFAMAANPFTLIAIGIAALITGLAVAYTKFEGFRNVVNFVVNSVIDYFEAMANAFIKLVNLVVDGINLVKPGSDVGKLNPISLPNIGGPGPVSGGGAGREGGTGSITPALPTMPMLPPSVITPPSGGGGAPDRGTPIPFQPPRLILPNPGSGGGGGGGVGGGGPDYVIQVNGGLATSAEIGQAVVNAIRAYNRSAGPAQIQVA